MKDNNYKLSFTTGGLFLQESVLIADLFLQINDWDEVRNRVVSENLLQARTESTVKRISREVILRMKLFHYDELKYLINASPQDQSYLLWLSVCRYYGFIAEFAVEVLHERFITLKGELKHIDFDTFFDKKAEWNDDLAQIKLSTRNKLRQVLFRMMREAGFIDKKFHIQTALLSQQISDLIISHNREELHYFPGVDN